MKMMMEVTEYVELPGIDATRAAFAEALYLAKGIYGTNATEWRIPRVIVRALMSTFDPDARMAHATFTGDGQLTIVDVPITVTYEEEYVRLVFRTETLEVSRVQ